MGSTRGLAHLHTHARHLSGIAPLWGRHRGRGESGLHQTHRPPPSPHDPQPLAGGPRGHHNPPPSRTTDPRHMPTLGTPPDGHAHRHEQAPVEPPAASPHIPTPRHTHQPHVPRGRASSGPLRGPPSSTQRHHPHHRPRRGLQRRSIRHPLTNAGPSPQRSTPHPLPTTSRMAEIPPLPPVPHADGTSSGPHSARKHRHASSLPRIQKAAPPCHASDTTLRTQRLETRTRPPGDGPSPTTNPTTDPE